MELDRGSSFNFIEDYFNKFKRAFSGDLMIEHQICTLVEMIRSVRKRGNKVIFVGNGASASISSHCALDFTKQGKTESICFSSDAFITAFSNDYGYDNWLTEAFRCHAKDGDLAILISSSGKSPNVVNAAKYCVDRGIYTVGLTGFAKDNPLNQTVDMFFWVDSKSYNIIECTHMFWLMAGCDLLIGKSEYPVS